MNSQSPEPLCDCSSGAIGAWGVGAALRNITFMDDLSHVLVAYYAKGTNAEENLFMMTKKDTFWEVDFNTKYNLYENLALILELKDKIDLLPRIQKEAGESRLEGGEAKAADVLRALQSLGYRPGPARKALKDALAAADPDWPVEKLLKETLKCL